MIVRDLGTMEYRAAWALQREVFDRVAQGGEEELLLCEHPPVYTLGKSGHAENMLAGEERLRAMGADFVHIDRGGDITFHGPGQLVAYPILDLQRHGMGLREYIFSLEQSIIDTLAVLGITAGRSEGAAGVWLERPLRKIAAIGVRSSRFVTMHGFALNVSTDLAWFGHINPCGFTDRGVTSMARELGSVPSMDEVKREYKKVFQELF